MIEIEYRIKRLHLSRLFFNEFGIKNHFDWCISVGLCETAGWINKDKNNMLEWVKPGHEDV